MPYLPLIVPLRAIETTMSSLAVFFFFFIISAFRHFLHFEVILISIVPAFSLR